MGWENTMATPSNSGEGGPTPIPDEVEQDFVGEQVRPSFHYGAHELRLGDQVTAFHRDRKINVIGRVIVLHGCVCISASTGVYPIQKLQIREVQPPIFE